MKDALFHEHCAGIMPQDLGTKHVATNATGCELPSQQENHSTDSDATNAAMGA